MIVMIIFKHQRPRTSPMRPSRPPGCMTRWVAVRCNWFVPDLVGSSSFRPKTQRLPFFLVLLPAYFAGVGAHLYSHIFSFELIYPWYIEWACHACVIRYRCCTTCAHVGLFNPISSHIVWLTRLPFVVQNLHSSATTVDSSWHQSFPRLPCWLQDRVSLSWPKPYWLSHEIVQWGYLRIFSKLL